jgi:hypothetical protein
MVEIMSKTNKTYKVTKTKHRTGQTYVQVGTLTELIKAYTYTLECGQSYEHEKGNKKINTNPQNIKSLVTNLNNASNNSTANGYSGVSYEFEEVE